MGYCYDRDNGLVCDSCGGSGPRLGVKKRTCAYRVDGMPYCPAPALCSACYRDEGGLRGVHGEKCQAGAAKSQAESDAMSARRAAGELFISGALSGPTWYVPAGQVGAEFAGRDGVRAWRLIPEDDYRREYGAKGLALALSDFPGTPVWEDDPGVRKAREAGQVHVYVVAPVSVCPEQFEAFEVTALDVIAVQAVAWERLGHEHYSVQRKDAVPAPLFGHVAEDGSVRL